MGIYDEIIAERSRQDEKWGGPQQGDARKGPTAWCADIEAYALTAKQQARRGQPEEYRRRMLQVAALAVAACESFDRLSGVESKVRAHVICCNASIAGVVLGSEERARAVMARLKGELYLRDKSVYATEADYDVECFWHTHTVDTL